MPERFKRSNHLIHKCPKIKFLLIEPIHLIKETKRLLPSKNNFHSEIRVTRKLTKKLVLVTKEFKKLFVNNTVKKTKIQLLRQNQLMKMKTA